MCLEAASKNWLSGFLATHPPLSERIFAIYGQDLSPIIPSDLYTDNPTEKPTLSTPFAPHVNTPLVSALATQTPNHTPTGTAPQSQTPTLETLANAIAQQIPSDLRAVLHTPLGAMQMMYAVMLMADQGDQTAALTSLAAYLPPAEIAQVSQYYQRIANMVEIDRIMWLELAMPTIRAQSPEVKKTFYTALCTVASSNQTLTLTEQLLIILTRQRLSPHHGQAVSQNLSLSQAGTALNQIASSLLAETAYADHAKALTAAGAVLQRYGMGITPSPSKMPLSTLAEAFDQINHLKPMAKSAVLDTLMALIHADGHVSSNEREFIRALCIAMQIPMAPNLHPSVA